jgi:hypothetical protein
MRSLGEAVLAREHRQGRRATRARVEIWRTVFSATLESTAVRLAARTVDAHGDEARPTR